MSIFTSIINSFRPKEAEATPRKAKVLLALEIITGVGLVGIGYLIIKIFL